jgi:hypothetical protein
VEWLKVKALSSSPSIAKKKKKRKKKKRKPCLTLTFNEFVIVLETQDSCTQHLENVKGLQRDKCVGQTGVGHGCRGRAGWTSRQDA